MIENDAITEIKNELCAIHPFGERFAQSLFFEEKLADALDARLEGFEKLQKQLSAFVDATLLLDSSDLSTSQRLALYGPRFSGCHCDVRFLRVKKYRDCI